MTNAVGGGGSVLVTEGMEISAARDEKFNTLSLRGSLEELLALLAALLVDGKYRVEKVMDGLNVSVTIQNCQSIVDALVIKQLPTVNVGMQHLRELSVTGRSCYGFLSRCVIGGSLECVVIVNEKDGGDEQACICLQNTFGEERELKAMNFSGANTYFAFSTVRINKVEDLDLKDDEESGSGLERISFDDFKLNVVGNMNLHSRNGYKAFAKMKNVAKIDRVVFCPSSTGVRPSPEDADGDVQHDDEECYDDLSVAGDFSEFSVEKIGEIKIYAEDVGGIFSKIQAMMPLCTPPKIDRKKTDEYDIGDLDFGYMAEGLLSMMERHLTCDRLIIYSDAHHECQQDEIDLDLVSTDTLVLEGDKAAKSLALVRDITPFTTVEIHTNSTESKWARSRLEHFENICFVGRGCYAFIGSVGDLSKCRTLRISNYLKPDSNTLECPQATDEVELQSLRSLSLEGYGFCKLLKYEMKYIKNCANLRKLTLDCYHCKEQDCIADSMKHIKSIPLEVIEAPGEVMAELLKELTMKEAVHYLRFRGGDYSLTTIDFSVFESLRCVSLCGNSAVSCFFCVKGVVRCPSLLRVYIASAGDFPYLPSEKDESGGATAEPGSIGERDGEGPSVCVALRDAALFLLRWKQDARKMGRLRVRVLLTDVDRGAADVEKLFEVVRKNREFELQHNAEQEDVVEVSYEAKRKVNGMRA
eukprot:GHVU01179008.1.p1 GENE.GHVU01179008.1~~GHVU01179008.1.p1  ORF type:complete len:770 (-),score=98.25 GHVU01179008.1:525-2621(-)